MSLFYLENLLLSCHWPNLKHILSQNKTTGHSKECPLFSSLFQKSKKWDKQEGNKDVSKIPHSLILIFLPLICSSQLTSTIEIRENLRENKGDRTPKHITELREENKINLVRNLLTLHHRSLENSLHCLWPHYYKPVIVSHIIFTKEGFYFIQNIYKA